MAEWITSSRLADVQRLRDFLDVARGLDNVLQAANIPNEIISNLAYVEALVRQYTDRVGIRQVLGIAFQELVSDVLGGLLNDAAYLMFHSNLRKVLDSYGIAPFVDNPEAREEVTFSGVQTQFRTLFSLETLSTTAERLGSSTLAGLEEDAPASGFDLWMDDVVSAFSDLGDFQRPTHGPGEETGALLVTVQSQDIKELFDRYAYLKKVWSRRTPLSLFPEIDTTWTGADGPLVNILPLREMGLLRTFRPYLTSEWSNTPPDFVRLSTADLIPLLGDALIDLTNLGSRFNAGFANLASLEKMATSLSAFAEKYLTLAHDAVEALQSIVNVMDALAATSLWIPLQDGGVPGLIAELEAARSSRKDLQRITFESNSGLQKNSVIPYDDALAIKATDPAFQFTPVENLLVAGVVVVFNKGELAKLLEDLFSDKEKDVTEDSGGDPTYLYPDELMEVTLPPDFSVSESIQSVAPPVVREGVRRPPISGRPVDPITDERSWIRDPVSNGAPTDLFEGTTVGASVRARTPRPTYSPTDSARQLRRAGATRTNARKVGPGRYDAFAKEAIRALGEESYPATVEISSSGWVKGTTGLVGDAEYGVHAERVPLGAIPEDAQGLPQNVVPSYLWRSAEYAILRLDAVSFDIAAGGTYVSGPDLDTIAAALGYVPGTTMTVTGPPWWIEFDARFAEWDAAGSVYYRPVRLRTRIVQIIPLAVNHYVVEPALPSYPVLDDTGYTGLFWVGGESDIRVSLEAKTGGDQYVDSVEPRAPGVTFEVDYTFRPLSDLPRDPISEYTFSTLAAVAGGTIVDADTAEIGAPAQVSLLVGEDQNHLPAPELWSATGAVISPLQALVPTEGGIGPFPPASKESYATGDVMDIVPAESERQVLTRAVKTYQARTNTLAALGYQQDVVSDRAVESTHDWRLVTARVPKQLRIGLGEMESRAALVTIARESWVGVAVKVGSGWITLSLGEALVPGATSSKEVTPRGSLVSQYGGLPWVLIVEWDTSLFPVEAIFIPVMRRVEVQKALYTSDLLSYGVSDYLATSGPTGIEARYEIAPPGNTGMFANSGVFSEEVYWVDAQLLRETSRRPRVAQSREVTLDFVPLADWSMLPSGLHSLLETSSHRVVVDVSLSSPRVSVYESDLSTGAWVLRVSRLVAGFPSGHRHRLAFGVMPGSDTLYFSLSIAENEADAEPGYTLLSVGSAVVAETDTYPYVRALDGYPHTGATIRIGHARSSSHTADGRGAEPFYETVETWNGAALEGRRWYRGVPPLGLFGMSTAVPTEAPTPPGPPVISIGPP